MTFGERKYYPVCYQIPKAVQIIFDMLDIDVEVDISNGIPCWEIVGLPDTSIRESKERVRTAIRNSGFELYSRKYIINLSPANIRKDGAILDLAIAVGGDGSFLQMVRKCDFDEKIKYIGVHTGTLGFSQEEDILNVFVPIITLIQEEYMKNIPDKKVKIY